MTSPRPSLLPGMEVTSNVRLLKPLSSGGMGAVWVADHLGLKTRVVVKFMLGELGESESARLRFSREAAAAAQVKSPHVVQMLDHGVSGDGVPFIVMEHLEGKDLGIVLEERGALEPADVVSIISQLAKALGKVHAAGLLHRDIKPDNVFVVDGEDDLFVKLLDFGVAKTNLPDDGGAPLDGETKTGQVVGTPFYMSPEQVTASKTIDLRSDLWALGVVAFEALTGKRPFDGPSFGALAVKIAAGPLPRPSLVNPSLPRAVDEWFAKACARDASARYGSARELADALHRVFEGVVSMPPVLSDSGPRPQLSPLSPPRTQPSRSAASAIGLATTLGQAEGSDRPAALARSAAGVVATDSPTDDAPSRSGAGSSPRARGNSDAGEVKSRRMSLVALGAVVFAITAVAGIAVVSWRTAPAPNETSGAAFGSAGDPATSAMAIATHSPHSLEQVSPSAVSGRNEHDASSTSTANGASTSNAASTANGVTSALRGGNGGSTSHTAPHASVSPRSSVHLADTPAGTASARPPASNNDILY